MKNDGTFECRNGHLAGRSRDHVLILFHIISFRHEVGVKVNVSEAQVVDATEDQSSKSYLAFLSHELVFTCLPALPDVTELQDLSTDGRIGVSWCFMLSFRAQCAARAIEKHGVPRRRDYDSPLDRGVLSKPRDCSNYTRFWRILNSTSDVPCACVCTSCAFGARAFALVTPLVLR